MYTFRNELFWGQCQARQVNIQYNVQCTCTCKYGTVSIVILFCFLVLPYGGLTPQIHTPYTSPSKHAAQAIAQICYDKMAPILAYQHSKLRVRGEREKVGKR